MAEFIYTTSTSLSGPWLIDSDKLEAFDKILDEEWSRIVTRNENLLKQAVEERFKANKYLTERISQITDQSKREAQLEAHRNEIESNLRSYSYREERSLTIYLKAKNKKIIVKSFGEAMRQQSLLEEMPVGFDAVLRCGDIKSEIELRRSGKLDISVSPEHLVESRELFAALQRWAILLRPPKWQRIWVFLNPAQWMLWLLTLLVSSIALVGSESAARSFHKEQAKQLLQDGLSQDEQLRALEIILALESGYVPPSHDIGLPGWFLLLFFGGFVACVVLTVTPKPRIGIGKGQAAIDHWRLWMNIVFILIPGFIFVNIIWPYVSRFFPSLY